MTDLDALLIIAEPTERYCIKSGRPVAREGDRCLSHGTAATMCTTDVRPARCDHPRLSPNHPQPHCEECGKDVETTGRAAFRHPAAGIDPARLIGAHVESLTLHGVNLAGPGLVIVSATPIDGEDNLWIISERREVKASNEAEWIECTRCQGDRGWMDRDTDGWSDCSMCQGEGGWRA